MPDRPPPLAPHVVAIGEALFDEVAGGRRVLGGSPLNFAIHVARLLRATGGGSTSLVTRVGRDALGDRLIDELVERGIETGAIQRDDQRPTGLVHVSTDAAGEPIFSIPEGAAWDAIEASADAGDLVGRCDALHFSPLAQRALPGRHGIQTLVHTAPAPVRLFDANLRDGHVCPDAFLFGLQHATALKLNLHELSYLASLIGLPDLPADDQISLLRERYCLSCVALTRGELGTVLYHEGGRFEGPTPATTPPADADAVGAGDACTAGLVVGLLRGLPAPRLVALCNAAGAFVASCPGATPELPDAVTDLAR